MWSLDVKEKYELSVCWRRSKTNFSTMGVAVEGWGCSHRGPVVVRDIRVAVAVTQACEAKQRMTSCEAFNLPHSRLRAQSQSSDFSFMAIGQCEKWETNKPDADLFKATRRHKAMQCPVLTTVRKKKSKLMFVSYLLLQFEVFCFWC